MPIWGIFYFLWDDPLFTYASSVDEWELKDPEFIELRRRHRLLALEVLYLEIACVKKRLTQEKHLHQETQAREVFEQILIERKVNEMDEDFSFVRAIGGGS
jgi:hypothetical protein